MRKKGKEAKHDYLGNDGEEQVRKDDKKKKDGGAFTNFR